MIGGKIAKPMDKLVFLFPELDSADLTPVDIHMSLHKLKRRSEHLSQKVAASLIEPPCPATNRKIDIQTGVPRPTDPNSRYRRSLAIFHTA